MPGAIPSATAPTQFGSTQTVQTGDVQNAPCGFCECASGKMVFIYNPSASHAGSGSIAIKTAANETAANAGAFSAATVITAESGSYYYGNPRVVRLRVGAHAGRLVASYTKATIPGGTGYQKEFKYSDDEGATWSAAINPANAGTDLGDLQSAPVCECPDGTLLIASFTSGLGDAFFTIRCFGSSDAGETWAQRSVVVGPTQAWGEADIQLIQALDGSYSLGCRVIDETTYVPANYRSHWFTSTDLTGAGSWTAHGVRAVSGGGSGIGGSPQWLQVQDGSLIDLYRSTSADPLKTHLARSTDRGATMTEIGLIQATGNMRYGQIGPLASGRFGVCFATETTLDNAAVYWQTWTMATYTPATPNGALTLNADDDWSQAGSVLTVTGATVGVRASATGVAYSVNGGVMVFDGTHADRFWLSLDGSTWTHALTIPAGLTTVYLSVLPTGGETSLSARVGVPL